MGGFEPPAAQRSAGISLNNQSILLEYILRPYGRAADPGRSGDTPLESFLKTFPKHPQKHPKWVSNLLISDHLGAKSHPGPPKWTPEGSKTPSKGPKGDPRAPTWGPKWSQRPHQSAKRTPDGALGATSGSLWEAFGGLWVAFGVILDTSGRQRGHFECKAPELRKTKDFIGKTYSRRTQGRPRCGHFK